MRAAVTNTWRVLQVLTLSVVALGFYKVARNFNSPVPGVARATPDASTLLFLNYVGAMTQLQEKVSAVIHQNDLSDVAAVSDRAVQAPSPDEQAAEMRNRLVAILSKLSEAAATASPAPEQGAGRPAQLDQKLVDEYAEWRKEYDTWLKSAAKLYQ